MILQSFFTSFYFCFLFVTALFAHASSHEKPFSCTGGAMYFNAHPADGLLYQNPSLLHDIYVFKCVTTIVMTSGNRGSDGNLSRSLERGIQESYALMANLRVDNPAMQETMVRVGINELHSWSLEGMRNIQIIYLRLPDCAPSGRGYVATRGASLSKLYYKEIDSITATDGNATYTLRDIKELIAFILHERKPKVIHILNHQAKFSDAHSASSAHADHIVSAKLVRGIVTAEKIKATVKSYAASNVRRFKANIEPLHHDFTKKSAALFKYAEYDDHMCQSLKHCKEKHLGTSNDDDVRYAAQYVGREYNVL
ncbi:hypothetical protein HBI38_016700 [Parastagonospora nodorum]|nr:hypothetical protein HBH43_046570 [Parastagonospora nodorum]KAH4234431.1 hypothetical protein HBI05_151060 [Parastagonospora nodorum]KAH4242497.1 hypothetical protein HBI06_020840 [Parastagonospora nodorum]KAH4265161.1 hypothetical protein HBI03_083300 [Parastagonospora nodorum]KAH4283331.1 hypothetical protein HBI04_021710 [Parastagonospora nodorum]